MIYYPDICLQYPLRNKKLKAYRPETIPLWQQEQESFFFCFCKSINPVKKILLSNQFPTQWLIILIQQSSIFTSNSLFHGKLYSVLKSVPKNFFICISYSSMSNFIFLQSGSESFWRTLA